MTRRRQVPARRVRSHDRATAHSLIAAEAQVVSDARGGRVFIALVPKNLVTLADTANKVMQALEIRNIRSVTERAIRGTLFEIRLSVASLVKQAEQTRGRAASG